MRKVVYQKCAQCDGTGKIDTSENSEEEGQPGNNKVLKYIQCFECKGEGKIPTAYFIEV